VTTKTPTPKRTFLYHLLSFFFGSWSANIIIFLNVAVFLYLDKFIVGDMLFRRIVLYPGNLIKGRWWCLVTSGFLHSDWQHLALNMLGVFIFTKIIERHLGTIKTLFIYVGSLVLSMLFATGIYSLVLHKNVAIIGASGAVMGLISAAMLLDPFRITYEMILPIPTMIKGWLFFYADIKGFLGAEKDGISHLSHLCGFLSVAFLVYFLSKRDKKLMRTGLMINFLSFIAFLFLRDWMLTKGISLQVIN